MSKARPSIEFEYPTEGRGPIPSFDSIEEEAEWWDAHDDNGRPVEFEVIVDLDSADHAALIKYARKKGMDPVELASMWIKEHLEEEAAREAKAF